MVALNNTPAPRGNRRKAPWIALAVLVIVALAVAAFFWGRSGGEPAPQAPPPTGDSRSSADATVPTAPPQVSWRLFQGIALPYSAEHGPAHVRGAVASGYAHTPTGALLASVHIVYRMALAPDGQWRPVVEQQVRGPGKPALVRQLQRVDRSRASGRIQQIAGFRFVSYDSHTAVVEIATGSTGDYTIGTRVLRWIDGDWRLYLADAQASTARAATDLKGFVIWNGRD